VQPGSQRAAGAAGGGQVPVVATCPSSQHGQAPVAPSAARPRRQPRCPGGLQWVCGFFYFYLWIEIGWNLCIFLVDVLWIDSVCISYASSEIEWLIVVMFMLVVKLNDSLLWWLLWDELWDGIELELNLLFMFFLCARVLGNRYEQWRRWSRLGVWVWLLVQATRVLFLFCWKIL
jgi:hypothetical protein